MRRRLNRDRTRVQLRHLRYFVKIVDAGSISRAATVIQFKFFNAAGSVALIAALSVAATSTAHAQAAASRQFPFSAPNTNDIPAGPLGDAIRYGEKVAAQTQTYAKKYVGSGLNCTSCHLDGGKTPYAAPWVGIWGQFPQYRSRNGRIDTLQDRINDCFERSMNGKALPADSTEMIGLLSYMQWLSKDVPTGAEVEGNGFIQIRLPPANQIDPARGKQIYAQQCGSCHGLDGQGRTGAAGAYLFPALWGARSFNIGAGMARLGTAAAFVKAKMPLGAGSSLSDQDAIDTAAYFTRQPRPDFAAKKFDWPKGGKPPDAPY